MRASASETSSGRNSTSVAPAGASGQGMRARSGDERAVPHAAAEPVHGADELGDEAGRRALVDVARTADLRHAAVLHHHDAVAERHRLGLVVGDVDRGDAEAAQQLVDLEPQRIAQLGVERGQRLVEQQGARLHGERARQRHALALAARELVDAAVGQRLDAHHGQHLGDAGGDLAPCGRLRIFRP